MLRTLCAGALAAFAAIVMVMPSPAGAHPGHDEAPATQNAMLLSEVVALGGGAEHFSAAAFRRAVSAASANEDQALRSTLGSPAVDRFDEIFTYVVLDGVGTMKRSGKPIPPPSSTDAKAIAAALYQAGLRDGTFDVERLFDTLFSPAVHDHAMIAVGRKYGAPGETAYHVVLARLVQDVGKP
jgi:hypothetical protein